MLLFFYQVDASTYNYIKPNFKKFDIIIMIIFKVILQELQLRKETIIQLNCTNLILSY